MATIRPLFRDQFINIYIDEEVPCLVNGWKGFVPSYRFREYILKLLDLYKENRERYKHLSMLADTRELHVLSPDDIAWVSKEINQKYVKLGCYYEAFLVPKDRCGETTVTDYITESDSNGTFTARMFSDIAQAKIWLKEVNNLQELASQRPDSSAS